MDRTYHRPVYHPASPVIAPQKSWELEGIGPTATPYSGGVWFDPADRKFKLWYMGGYVRHLCLATSDDGITWTKPSLDVARGTNKVIPGGAPESNTLWMDLNEPDPQRRFKYFIEKDGALGYMYYRYSADGINWSGEQWKSGDCGDRTTLFYNPFRNKYVFLIRDSFFTGGRGRATWLDTKESTSRKDFRDVRASSVP